MTFEEAEEIICLYDFYLDKSCTCFQGNPPCGKCECMPSSEDYEEASKKLERGY